LINYIKTKPRHSDDIGLKDIKPNEGKIIEFEGEKFGAYRDENNIIHFVDAECTHLGCMIKWNNDEKSWDCPCHGSRFTYEGEVLNGPANKPLPYYSQNKVILHNL
jgi:Rieske Fe-S protein